MSYLKKSLGKGERVVAIAKFHWWYTMVAILALIFLGIFIVGIWIFIKRIVFINTTEIAVTTHRFIFKRGLFTLRTDEISLPNIEGVKVHQDFWGKILGYGHMRVEGTGVDAVDLPCIAHPVRFRSAFETAKEEAKALR